MKDGHLYNQYPWFWWSIEAGIHLSTPPEIYQLVKGINNIGHVLISEINKSAFVKDIYNENYIRYVEYPTREIMKKRIKERLTTDPYNKIKDFKINFGAVNAKSIDDNSKVFGEALVVLEDKRARKSFAVILNFDAFECVENIYIYEIKPLFDRK